MQRPTPVFPQMLMAGVPDTLDEIPDTLDDIPLNWRSDMPQPDPGHPLLDFFPNPDMDEPHLINYVRDSADGAAVPPGYYDSPLQKAVIEGATHGGPSGSGTGALYIKVIVDRLRDPRTWKDALKLLSTRVSPDVRLKFERDTRTICVMSRSYSVNKQQAIVSVQNDNLGDAIRLLAASLDAKRAICAFGDTMAGIQLELTRMPEDVLLNLARDMQKMSMVGLSAQAASAKRC